MVIHILLNHVDHAYSGKTKHLKDHLGTTFLVLEYLNIAPIIHQSVLLWSPLKMLFTTEYSHHLRFHFHFFRNHYNTYSHKTLYYLDKFHLLQLLVTSILISVWSHLKKTNFSSLLLSLGYLDSFLQLSTERQRI
jgi:hypothetical protein